MKVNEIYNENCLDTMARMEDNFIDLTITSPPYDNLRTYKGFDFDWKAIIKELYRTTKQGGVVVWIVGDATIKGSETGTSFKQALHAIDCGFNLHDTMIYSKASQPRQNGHRYEQQFEYMFVFSKGKTKIKNIIKEPSKNAGKFVKRTCRDGGKDELKSSKNIVSDLKTKGNVWFYGTKKNDTKHPAIFPEQLANDHIISWSNEGDLIYDCFMGSGTTAKMAKVNNRNYIGSEISEEYCNIANERLT
jgi:site-specific DNA-methyltransferase (adenine-specific)